MLKLNEMTGAELLRLFNACWRRDNAKHNFPGKARQNPTDNITGELQRIEKEDKQKELSKMHRKAGAKPKKYNGGQ